MRRLMFVAAILLCCLAVRGTAGPKAENKTPEQQIVELKLKVKELDGRVDRIEQLLVNAMEPREKVYASR